MDMQPSLSSMKSAESQFQKQVEDRLNELKMDVSERPYVWLGVAFLSGFVSNSFPARLLFGAVVKIISWLLGPAILLMGIIKASDLFTSPRAQGRRGGSDVGPVILHPGSTEHSVDG